METREKILVAAMVIALGYGGYELVGKKYIERSKAAPTSAQGELQGNCPAELKTFCGGEVFEPVLFFLGGGTKHTNKHISWP